MTMKRRVVYMDDETWERLRFVADGQGVTMSEVLRRASLSPPAPPIAPGGERKAAPSDRPSPMEAQRRRDEVLRRVNRRRSGGS